MIADAGAIGSIYLMTNLCNRNVVHRGFLYFRWRGFDTERFGGTEALAFWIGGGLAFGDDWMRARLTGPRPGPGWNGIAPFGIGWVSNVACLRAMFSAALSSL
jgi:hypothetical protein